MKQIVDKLNKIALAIDENVEIPTTDLIIDSLDAITKAYGGTPNDSKLIVDKLEAISEVASGGSTPTGTIEITSNGTVDVAQYRYADVNVSGGGGMLEVKALNTATSEEIDTNTWGYALDDFTPFGFTDLLFTIDGVEHVLYPVLTSSGIMWSGDNYAIIMELSGDLYCLIALPDTQDTEHTFSLYAYNEDIALLIVDKRLAGKDYVSVSKINNIFEYPATDPGVSATFTNCSYANGKYTLTERYAFAFENK